MNEEEKLIILKNHIKLQIKSFKEFGIEIIDSLQSYKINDKYYNVNFEKNKILVLDIDSIKDKEYKIDGMTYKFDTSLLKITKNTESLKFIMSDMSKSEKWIKFSVLSNKQNIDWGDDFKFPLSVKNEELMCKSMSKFNHLMFGKESYDFFEDSYEAVVAIKDVLKDYSKSIEYIDLNLDIEEIPNAHEI